jgi:hypothetical protein
MDEDVILNVGSSRFILTLQEAMDLAMVINSCQRIGSKWAKNGSVTVVEKPSNDSCYISPITAIFRMELDSNARLIEEENKK